MSANSQFEVCIVGGGPRGLSVLERLCANERASQSCAELVVHIVDPAAPGAGAVWRTEQSGHLLMNTVASQITVYTDDSASISGPIEPGPSLFDWSRSLPDLDDSVEYDRAAEHDSVAEYDRATLDAARLLGPDSYPTRALYGRYLRDSFTRILANAPKHLRFQVHRARAVAMADTHGVPGGPQGIRLEDGTRLHDLDAIVLAQGHVPARLTPREARTASLARIHYLTYLTPANPADLDLSGIGAGQNVLLRGLGLNFFDHMALLTIGRGGSFHSDNGRLTYQPSGQEPKLFAFSRRGVPYHSRGQNEKGVFGRYTPRLLSPAHIAKLRGAARDHPVNFGRDLWPLIAVEVESVYYATLLTRRGCADEAGELAERYLGLPPEADRSFLLAEYHIPREDWWSWQDIAKPYGDRVFRDRADFRAWLLGYLARDVEEAETGNLSSPLKAALDVLRDLRNEVRLAVDHAGLEGNSHRDELEGWYTPLNAFLSIGPPASRIREMIALIEAGILEITGPGTEVRIDTETPAFVARSTVIPGPAISATVLIEARLPEPDLRRTADPLLAHLLETEQATVYRIPGLSGTSYETGGLAVTERPYHLIDGQGRAHPRRFAYGVPTESVHWVTAAGIRPGVDSVILGDSDAIARAVLALPPVTEVPFGLRPPTDETDLLGVLV